MTNHFHLLLLESVQRLDLVTHIRTLKTRHELAFEVFHACAYDDSVDVDPDSGPCGTIVSAQLKPLRCRLFFTHSIVTILLQSARFLTGVFGE